MTSLINRPQRELGAVLAAGELSNVHGRVRLCNAVRLSSRALAEQDFMDCQAREFSCDAVRDLPIPGWLTLAENLLPVAELRTFRLALRADRPMRLYATCGVDPHIDEIDGLMVAVVLHADGFTFEQGQHRQKLAVGDWFVFDDALEHAVTETREATTLLVLAAALKRL